MPWSATITYGRDPNPYWDERVCAENVEHDYSGAYYSDKNAHLPTAAKPEFLSELYSRARRPRVAEIDAGDHAGHAATWD